MPKREIKYLSPRLSKAIGLFSRIVNWAQGKGYGSVSIKKENEIVHDLLGKPPILAVDIGGNIGDYSAEIRNRNCLTEIHIFEPSYTNIDKLNKRFSKDKNIKILPYAVSNASGTATLFANEAGSGLGSLTKRRLDHFDIYFSFTEKVETIAFEDYWIDVLNRRVIDIVKLDIEGHELAALHGFGSAIKNVNVVQFEFGGCNIDTRIFFQDFWYFFEKWDFDLFRITPFGAERIFIYKESDEYFSTTNFIALNRDIQ